MRKIRCYSCGKIFYVGGFGDLICPYCHRDNSKFITLDAFGLKHDSINDKKRIEYIFRGNEDVVKGKKMPRLW